MKISLNDLVNLENEGSVVTTINGNNTTLEQAFDNTLSRDGASPNQMGAPIDMNSNRIFNLPPPQSISEPLRFADIAAVTGLTTGTLALQNANAVTITGGTITGVSLTGCTGLSVTTGLSGLGTGVATFLTTPSSANLAAAIADETGTGSLVFATSPTLTTPSLSSPTLTGTPTAPTATLGDNSTKVATTAFVQSAVTSGTFTQSGTGAVTRTAVSKLRERYSVEDFGAVGDGATDDRAALQAAFDAVSAAGGGEINCAFGKSYRVVVNSGITDLGLILKSGVVLKLNGSSINLECTGSVYGIRFRDNTHVIGPGTVQTTVSSSPGSQSVWHAPLALGAAYGEVTSVGAIGNYINASRWSIRNVTVATVRTNGYCIAGIGGLNHGVIEDINYPDSANNVGCLNFDWGTVGSISSGDVPNSRIAFDAGLAYTVHPHNISIQRLKIGNMTNASSCPIRFSGVHAIRLDGFEIAQSKAYGVFHTAGDLGYEFADSATKRSRHSGIEIRNGSILSANTGNAVYCDMYADNIALAIGSGYAPYLSAVNTTDIVFENIRSIGTLAAGAGDGIVARYMEGGVFRNCFMQGHGRGMVVAEFVKRLRIQGGDFNSNQSEGIYIGNASVPEECIVDGAWCWSNGIGGVFAGINIASGKRHKVINCRLGNVGESFQDYGVLVSSSASDTEINNNHCIGHSGSGSAYSVSTSTGYGVLAQFSGNTADSNYVTTYYSGVNIIPYEYFVDIAGDVVLTCRAAKASLTTNTTPTGGTWKLGTIIFYTDPATGDYIGTTCVSSGSPGTWKKFGATT